MTNLPLSGYRVIELAGIGPGPYAGQLLSDLGADVITVERPSKGTVPAVGVKTVDRRGKRSVVVDLQSPQGVEIVLKLVKNSDILFEGNRPGVTERLGIGPEDCHKINPKLVYGRMTGWGQTGPWANMAGHDINYISVTGALEAIGSNDHPPPPPLNLIGDYGGGTMNLVIGILAALLNAEKTGKGDVVDAAIIDGVSSMMGIVYSLASLNTWQTKRHSNLLDGAMPYYRCYATQDARYMAVGCIEPQFFAQMLQLLEIAPEEFGPQNDPKCWKSQHLKLETVFGSKSRSEWANLFDGTDACVTPVLDYQEAISHKQNIARNGLFETGGLIHPQTMPKFANLPDDVNTDIPIKGADTETILREMGYTSSDISTLTDTGVISCGR